MCFWPVIANSTDTPATPDRIHADHFRDAIARQQVARDLL